MTTVADFFARAELQDQLIADLYHRLDEVVRASRMQYPIRDEFEQGIDCRLANEERWLRDLLDKVERSR